MAKLLELKKLVDDGKSSGQFVLKCPKVCVLQYPYISFKNRAMHSVWYVLLKTQSTIKDTSQKQVNIVGWHACTLEL